MKQPASGRHRKPALFVIVALVGLGLVPGRAAAHQPPTFTAPPVIVGDATVGSTLGVQALYTRGVLDPGDPPVVVTYQWRACPASGGGCKAVTGATASTYEVSAADLGQALEVRVTLANSLGQKAATTPRTPAVTQPPAPGPTTPPPTTPPPTTPPPTTPPPTSPGGTPVFDSTGTYPPLAAASAPRTTTTPASVTASPATPRALPAYLRPFPVVRIRGFFSPGGARVTLLSVGGPRGATVNVRCSGRGCPVRRLGPLRAPVRLRALERYLRAGIVLDVRVTKATRIGKFTRLRIRTGRTPARRDACLRPGRTTPVRCPGAR